VDGIFVWILKLRA